MVDYMWEEGGREEGEGRRVGVSVTRVVSFGGDGGKEMVGGSNEGVYYLLVKKLAGLVMAREAASSAFCWDGFSFFSFSFSFFFSSFLLFFPSLFLQIFSQSLSPPVSMLFVWVPTLATLKQVTRSLFPPIRHIIFFPYFSFFFIYFFYFF